MAIGGEQVFAIIAREATTIPTRPATAIAKIRSARQSAAK
jgi:hypothetical protein